MIRQTRFEVRKSKRKTKCRDCEIDISRKDHIVRIESTFYCLNCGEKRLNGDKEWYKKRLSECNKCLRALRRYPKERVVQRLS